MGWFCSFLFVAFTSSEDQPEIIRSQRILELQQSQDVYKWETEKELYKNLPGCLAVSLLDKVPQQRKAFEEVKDRFNQRKNQATKICRLSSLLNVKDSWYSFDDLKEILGRLPGDLTQIYERDQWMDDTVFGWQFLNGCNPNSLRRCKVLPENFSITEEMVSGFLDRGRSLDEEIKVFRNLLTF